MPVDSTHFEYDENAAAWLRSRDVFAGEDAVKAAGERAGCHRTENGIFEKQKTDDEPSNERNNKNDNVRD